MKKKNNKKIKNFLKNQIKIKKNFKKTLIEVFYLLKERMKKGN